MIHLKALFAAAAALIAVILGLAVGALVVIALTLESAWFSNQVQSHLAEKWGLEVDWSNNIEVDWSWVPTLTIERPTVTNVPWGEKQYLARAESISVHINLRRLLHRTLLVEKLVLEQPRVHLRRSPDKGPNWQALISGEVEPPLLQTRFKEIEINDGRLTYEDPAKQTDIATEVDTGQQGQGQSLRFDSTFEGRLSWIEKTGIKSSTRPPLKLTLDVETLNMDQTPPMLVPSDGHASENESASEKEPAEQSEKDSKRWSRLIKEQTAALRDLNFDLNIRVQQLTVKGRELDNLSLQAGLASGLLEVDNFSGELGEGSFTVTGTLNASQPLPRGNLTVKLKAMNMGRLLPAFEATELGYLEGTFTTRLENQALLLEDSSLRYWHESKNTDIDIKLASHTTKSGAAGVRLDADGRLHDRPFSFEFSGGPLLDLDDPNKPYPLSVDSTFGKTEIRANGTLTQPLLLKAVDLQLQAQGPDPAQLWYITPFTLPHLPPYDIDARLERDGRFWYLRSIDGTVGDSDLSGTVRWHAPLGERPEIWATLTSRLLDLDDLLPVVGAAPGTGSGEKSSPAQEAMARQQATRDEVLPQAKLMRGRLQAVDAHLDFKALEMQSQKVPFEQVVLELDLEQGVINVHPLTLHFAEGEITVNGELNTNSDPAEGNAKLEISRVNLKRFAEHFNIANDTRGVFGGGGRVTFTGNSVQQALGTLDGRLELLMSDGQMDALLVEAMGLDFGEVLFSLGDDKPDPVEILCLYSKLKATDGQADIEAFTLATSDSNIVGKGNVNFARESYELTLEARPKDFSILSSSSPVRIYGDFNSYTLDVVSEELVARGALALLGAVIFPPAALLPLVEPGTASGQAGCQQLLSSAEAQASE